MADIMQTVEMLNSKVASLNNERSRQLGMQETAKDQYNKALQAYEMKYGVKLTEANLQEEYNKVFADTKGKVAELQEAISVIERGDYKNVERPKDIDLNPNVEVPKPQPKVQPQAQAQPQLSSEGVADSNSIANFGPRPKIDIAAMNAEAQAKQEVNKPKGIDFGVDMSDVEDEEPVTPTPSPSPINFGGVPTQPTQPVQPTFGAEPVTPAKEQSAISFGDVEDDDEESFTPSGWGSTSTADINQSFTDILNPNGIKFGE